LKTNIILPKFSAGEIPVETLLAMVLANARTEVEAYAGQPVKDTVIAVPINFGPSEREAVNTAAQIAGLNLLQLLSSGASAALNYGVFRYKDITEQAQVQNLKRMVKYLIIFII
jgi:molecular chaperone DnaK (HSP70)